MNRFSETDVSQIYPRCWRVGEEALKHRGRQLQRGAGGQDHRQQVKPPRVPGEIFERNWSRRHSLPSEGSTRGGSLSNGAVTIELVSSGSGESAGRDSSPESTEVLPSIYVLAARTRMMKSAELFR